MRKEVSGGMDPIWVEPELSWVLFHLQFQPEEPKEAEAPSRDQDVPTDQKQADSVVGSWAWAHSSDTRGEN